MKIGIPKERFEGETRVSVTPPFVAALVKEGHAVYVEKDAGSRASFHDSRYEEAGAAIVEDSAALLGRSDAVLKINPLQMSDQTEKHEVELLGEGSVLIGFLMPQENVDTVRRLKSRGITSFSMEFVPRISRAQSMDALSSMATVAGYKAVLLAADHIGKFFPLLMTAAGTIPPASVLVLGAGVAGLQAIATAKRLGAKVEAFDPRPAVREQVQSLGAQFIEMELEEEAETAGGYAKEQPEAFLRKEQETIAARLPKVDVVITTAQVFGKRAPILITEEMVEMMKPGSLIVDLAVRQGGNCELSQGHRVVEKHGVTIHGAWNLAASVPVDASRMYAKNITELFRYVCLGPGAGPNFEDEITRSACITHQGEIVNDFVRNLLKEEKG